MIPDKKDLRMLTGVLTAFIALTAIAGGTAILAGLDKFPEEWLTGTPFNNYTLPALILIMAVGGSASAASITSFGNHPSSVYCAMAADLIMAGQITGE
jgi:hypothetical protein